MNTKTDIASKAIQVLLVDDHESNILTLKGLLKDDGYKILTAANGEAALDIAEKKKPDLILLDIKMPGMDGFEVCRRLKSTKETHNIPVIFLTVLNQTSDIVKGLELGAEDYVSKPFQAPELLARVHTHIQLKLAKDEITRSNFSLAQKNDQLALLNSAKDKLLSIISHDLRAPMGTLKEILGFIMTHYNDLEPQRLHDSLESMRESIESSYTLVENLLYWARNQRGEILFKPGMHNINELIDESVRLMTATAHTKKISLTNDLSADSKAYYDRNMISVVLRNLTHNAIKFTREGGNVTFSVNDDPKEPQNYIIVDVRDNGIGMKQEDLNIILQDTTTFSTSGTGIERGSGLGLKLCREFVEKNGGRIWAESEPGKGSTFKFTLSKKVLPTTP
jgi:two-component system sensor histidine kinase/response regulator